jgi:hypothetical protein
MKIQKEIIKKHKSKAGRPKIIVDWNKVNKYLQAQCNGTGIASLLGISPMTLYRACERKFKVNFEAYSSQKKAEGKELLRGKQFQTAMEGDKTMLVWLGKQYLEQKDKSDLTSDNKELKSNQIVINWGIREQGNGPDKKTD